MSSLPSSLYRMFDAEGVLLYVGVTSTRATRFDQHPGDKDWWPEVANITIEHFPSRALAAAAETVAILFEQPRYNKSGAVPPEEMDQFREAVLAKTREWVALESAAEASRASP